MSVPVVQALEARLYQHQAAESADQFPDKRLRLRVVEVLGNSFPCSNSKAFPKAPWAEALTGLLDAFKTPVSANRRPIIRNPKPIS